MIAVERRVMDLHDEGETPKRIAEILGITHKRAASIVGTYRIGRTDRFVEDARRGSAALLASILALQARMGATS